jgi:hypothetical protein
MDELTLVAGLRDDIPTQHDMTGPERRLRAEISAASASAAVGEVTGGPWQQRRPGGFPRKVIIIGSAAAVLAGAVAVTVDQVAAPPTAVVQPSRPGTPAHGPAATSAELVAFATSASAASPAFNPRPHDWIYVKAINAVSTNGGHGPLNERVTSAAWTRVDGRVGASTKHGKLRFESFAGQGGFLGGWQEIGGISLNYRYLESLPSSPAKLTAVIAANIKVNGFAGSGNIGIFNAIRNLMLRGVLPPRLLASLYGVLANLPGVHFDARGTDLADRRGQGFYTLQEGYFKDEIVINPRTFAFMGEKQVAVKAHTDVASDGTTHLRKGQAFAWYAVLQAGIVPKAGQLP